MFTVFLHIARWLLFGKSGCAAVFLRLNVAKGNPTADSSIRTRHRILPIGHNNAAQFWVLAAIAFNQR